MLFGVRLIREPERGLNVGRYGRSESPGKSREGKMMLKLMGYVAAGIFVAGTAFALPAPEVGKAVPAPRPAQVAPLKVAPFSHTNRRNRCAPMDRIFQAVPDRQGGTRCL